MPLLVSYQIKEEKNFICNKLHFPESLRRRRKKIIPVAFGKLEEVIAMETVPKSLAGGGGAGTK